MIKAAVHGGADYIVSGDKLLLTLAERADALDDGIEQVVSSVFTLLAASVPAVRY